MVRPLHKFLLFFQKKMRLNTDFSANSYLELEDQNLVDSIIVVSIASYIANSVNAVCKSEYFYICRVPDFGSEAYLLFSIYRDADWELWKRGIGCACIGGSSYLEESDYLLEKYAVEKSIAPFEG